MAEERFGILRVGENPGENGAVEEPRLLERAPQATPPPPVHVLHPRLAPVRERTHDAPHEVSILGLEGLRLPIPVREHGLAARTEDSVDLPKECLLIDEAFKNVV